MSILRELECKGIVSFDTFLESSVYIEECCDNYYSVELNKKEFGQMIEELKELHFKMVD